MIIADYTKFMEYGFLFSLISFIGKPLKALLIMFLKINILSSKARV